MSKIIAAYGGGFKPPTAGHFEVVKTALGKHPEIDEFIIYIGSGERDGISQDESILVWDIFANYLPMKVQIEPSNGPIGDIIRLGKNNPEDKIYFVIGGREGNEGDMKDIASRTKNIEAAYPNMKIKVITTPDKGMSGTNARKAAKKSEEELSKFLPKDLTPKEKLEVFNIIRPVVKEMISEEIPNDVINSFDIQDTLVKDVWVDGELQPEIREKLLKIAQDFFDSLELPEGTILKDIKLTGSFANFNWSKFSDVDLHLVLDFSEISDNEEFAKDYFMAKKNLWNNAHDINIFGYPVEVYVEDKDEPHTASGLYSILNDEWITIPQQQKIIIDKDDIKSKAEGYLSLLPQFEKMFEAGKYEEVINSIDKTKERIRDMRSSGLEKGGLYSVENLAFKVLRRSDFVEQLNILKTNSYDAMMSLNEEVSKFQLDSIEDYADKLFAKLGIDIEFTRHFLDRLNDKRNNKPISVAELLGIFKRLHRKHGKPLSKTDNDFEAVVKDFNNNINIPFAINVTPEDIDLVAKTIMRKKDFKTSTPVIPLNENASYSKNINLIDRLATLTQHMLDKGMNIEPLPKLEFIDGDKENASDFLGKTAYYDPETKTIFLYTEGRHPKDIARSFSHEMVHHTQNLEDRLNNIRTTNTQDDEELNDLEAEANLKGTMTFRNWTDSIREEKNKDPFGLSQYARELASGLEEIRLPEEDIVSSPPMKYKIFSDMDGVLTDFDDRFKNYSNGVMPSSFEKRYGKDKFWELIDNEGVAYWVGMPWMGDGKKYWDYIKDLDTELLSSPSRSETSRLGKRLWVKNNMPGAKLHLAYSHNKKNYAEPNHILVDDRPSNIEQWVAAGGIGILHRTADETIGQLKKLGL